MCLKPCERRLDCEFRHPCKKRCHQKCGDCSEMVQRVIPKCGHPQFMQCHEDVYDFVCQAECNVTLACGHPCGDRSVRDTVTDLSHPSFPFLSCMLPSAYPH